MKNLRVEAQVSQCAETDEDRTLPPPRTSPGWSNLKEQIEATRRARIVDRSSAAVKREVILSRLGRFGKPIPAPTPRNAGCSADLPRGTKLGVSSAGIGVLCRPGRAL